MSIEDSLQKSFGSNPGNMLFWSSSHRMLTTPRQDVVSDWIGPSTVERVNREYDHVVIPMANAFGLHYIKHLEALTDAIEKLTIPITILSIGLQVSTDMKREELAPLDKAVKRFVKAVLDHGPCLGVRGEYTAEYVRSLGFSEVEVIGCPSTFRYGADLRVEKKLSVINSDSKLSFTINEKNYPFAETVQYHLDNYHDITYIPQDLATLKFMVNGGPMNIPKSKKLIKMPLYPAHPVFINDQALSFVDITTWLDYIKDRDFMFGDRIHGTIAALLAGTPGFLLPHDARTLELAKYHKIPYSVLPKGEVVDAAELYEKADFTEFNNGQATRFKQFESYLKKHNLEHALNNKKALEKYDNQVASAGLPGPIRAASAQHGLKNAYYNARYKITSLLGSL